MLKYDNFITNEAKRNFITYEINDYVLIKRNFISTTEVENKIAIIEDKLESNGKLFYMLRIQKPKKLREDLAETNLWKGFSKTTHHYVDNFVISQGQAWDGISKIDKQLAEDLLNNKVIKFSCSPRFNEILNKMLFKIENHYTEYSFVDINLEKSDQFTYTPINKIELYADNYKLNSRQPARISKLLKKLKPSLSDKELEEAVYVYKSKYEDVINKNKERITVVTGEDIRYWYHYTRYGATEHGRTGSLGNSCMRHEKSQKRFDIYCENTDLCALLIYKTPDGEKLLARALLWKLKDGRVYLDRIYSVDDTTYNVLKNYGREKNMLLYSDINLNNDLLEVQLKKDFGAPYQNPYMDTFKFFDRDNLLLITPRGRTYTGNYREYNSHD